MSNQMATTTTQTVTAEIHQESDYHDEEPFYYCAYCNADRGRDCLDQMCADCFWEHDSLRKRPGRIWRSLLDPKYASADQQERVLRWIKEAEDELEKFEEKLEEGQERLHRELELYDVYGEEDSVDDAAALTDDEIHEQLFELDKQRKEMRYQARDSAVNIEESDEYKALDRVAQSLVDELTKRRKQ
jgi:vacuolar-type H+-ATPase subunit H